MSSAAPLNAAPTPSHGGVGLVAIVGRPNVGKSSLFNALLGRRAAIVSEVSGTTRDRIIAEVEYAGRTMLLVDTGGIVAEPETEIEAHIMAQVDTAMGEADAVVFVTDAVRGLTHSDEQVAGRLRRSGRPVILVVNKVDSQRQQALVPEMYALGLGEPIALSALHRRGIDDVLEAVLPHLPPQDDDDAAEEPQVAHIAIVGRPNVGKSALANAILGMERSIVSEVPGTTRDALDTALEIDGTPAVLIDTAGMRRRGAVKPGIERFSVLRAARAVHRSDVAVVVLDAEELVTDQDQHITGLVMESFKGAVAVVNKWDLIEADARREAEHARAMEEFAADLAAAATSEATEGISPQELAQELAPAAPVETPEPADAADAIASLVQRRRRGVQRTVLSRLRFMDHVPVVFTSALLGQGIDELLAAVMQVHNERRRWIPPRELTDVIMGAVSKHLPPKQGRRTLKIYRVKQESVGPPTFVFYCNNPHLMHFSYERYLENALREAFGFNGTHLRLEFRGHGKIHVIGDHRAGREQRSSRTRR